MARGAPHDPSMKAAALAALLSGQRVDAVAREYKLPKQTVSEWNKQAKRLLSELDRTEKETLDIGDGLSRYLQAALAALVVHVEHTTDKAWLRKQDASSLAVLHGVLVDKVVRLLEAAEASRDGELPTDGEAAALP